VQAAEALGVSVLDLAYHPHARYWVRVGSTYGRWKAWAQERAAKR
jgi:hypothetical protein